MVQALTPGAPAADDPAEADGAPVDDDPAEAAGAPADANPVQDIWPSCAGAPGAIAGAPRLPAARRPLGARHAGLPGRETASPRPLPRQAARPIASLVSKVVSALNSILFLMFEFILCRL